MHHGQAVGHNTVRSSLQYWHRLREVVLFSRRSRAQSDENLCKLEKRASRSRFSRAARALQSLVGEERDYSQYYLNLALGTKFSTNRIFINPSVEYTGQERSAVHSTVKAKRFPGHPIFPLTGAPNGSFR